MRMTPRARAAGSGRIEVATQVGDNTAPHGPILGYDLA